MLQVQNDTYISTMEVQYIRVSTMEQNTDRQIIEGMKSFIDKISGTIPFKDRPEASKLINLIERGEITALHVHSIDRLGRSTIDILNTIQWMTDHKVNVIAKKEGLQTMTEGEENKTAKMVLSIMATLADFELNMIRERQREGIAQAKARGAYKGNGGSKPQSFEQLMTKPKNANCVKELKRGESIRRAAKLSGVSPNQALKLKKLAGL